MGLIRLWLALLVYFEHLGGFGLTHLLSGIMAVKSFFIISGFLIQLVLLRKYQYASRLWQWNFWKSRFVRIYFLYWIVLSGSVIFLVITGEAPRLYKASPADYGMTHAVLHHQLIFNHGNLLAKIWYIASHVFIFGYDISQYIIYNIQQAKFTLIGSSEYIGHLWGRSFMLITQGWSIAIELWFYLLAPFILLRSTLSLIIITLAITYLRQHIHFDCDVYALDIFSELYFFAAGAIACRFYLAKLQSSYSNHYLSIFLLLALFVYTVNYQLLHFVYKEVLFYLLFAAALPFIFSSFHRNPIDRFLGDLSYPIYLVHFLAYGLAAVWFNTRYNPFTTLLLTLGFAVLSVLLVERPLERWRHKLFVGKLSKKDKAEADPLAIVTC
jgi:peptidoglycan/LPS O-acetylase OafA/YrhL